MLKFSNVYLSLRGQKVNGGSQKAPDIGENRPNHPAQIGVSLSQFAAGQAHEPLFGKQGKVVSLGHLHFDIVSDFRLPT